MANMGDMVRGKRVLITQVDAYMGEPIAETFEALGAEVIRSTSELSSPKAADEVVLGAGEIDVVIANFAEKEWWSELIPDIKDDQWLEYFDELVHPLMRIVRAVTPQMIARGSGKIVAITSAAPLRGIPKATGYCAARGAQNAFVRAAGLELARNNIQFNAIAQNYVENKTYYPPELIANEEMMKRMLKVVPAGRLGKGEETAYFAAFLASNYSDFFVGQVFPFSGGWVTST